MPMDWSPFPSLPEFGDETVVPSALPRNVVRRVDVIVRVVIANRRARNLPLDEGIAAGLAQRGQARLEHRVVWRGKWQFVDNYTR